MPKTTSHDATGPQIVGNSSKDDNFSCYIYLYTWICNLSSPSLSHSLPPFLLLPASLLLSLFSAAWELKPQITIMNDCGKILHVSQQQHGHRITENLNSFLPCTSIERSCQC